MWLCVEMRCMSCKEGVSLALRAYIFGVAFEIYISFPLCTKSHTYIGCCISNFRDRPRLQYKTPRLNNCNSNFRNRPRRLHTCLSLCFHTPRVTIGRILRGMTSYINKRRNADLKFSPWLGLADLAPVICRLHKLITTQPP